MVEFKPGDVVNITIERAEVVSIGYDDRFDSPYLRVAIAINDDEMHGRIHLDATDVTVEHAAPTGWPARPGDVWCDRDGFLWFGQSLGGSQMALIPALVRGELDTALPAYVLEKFGPMTLVHRADGAS